MKNSLEQTYVEHFPALHRFAIGLTGSTEEASDIIQTVFMRLAAKQDSLSVPVTKAYLFAAVRNGARDFWKRTKAIPFSQVMGENPEGGDMEIDIPDTAPGPIKNAEAASDLTTVLAALQMLTEEQRVVLSLKYLSGFSTSEVAVELGKSENTIRQMEFRALRSLRRVIQHNKLI